jgi:hypothetical protein
MLKIPTFFFAPACWDDFFLVCMRYGYGTARDSCEDRRIGVASPKLLELSSSPCPAMACKTASCPDWPITAQR